MRRSWNEVRARAATFANEWRDAAYEKGDTQSFYNDFFQIFGVRRRSVARYEAHVQKLDNRHGYIDLFWPGVLLVEQKSAGRDLARAREQALEYFDALPESDRPRFLLLSDFQNFELEDLDEGQAVRFALAELHEHVQDFGFILGVQRRAFRDQDPANNAAAELVGRLHDELAATRYRGHDLERLLVRIVFCLFADDTGIFEPRDLFLEFIETRTAEDGADLGPWLTQLFEVLNTPDDERSNELDEDLAQFPYVNGDLFEGTLRTASFNTQMRQVLLEAGHFDWSSISPAIFGALFQSVMNPEERRAQGAHYTTEKNILKVIEPLFLDDLKDELQRLTSRRDNGRRTALLRFQEKLANLRFLDPACGCGNFLIIAYRELRLLEVEIIQALDEIAFSRIDVDQFYGIEIGEFPARIAETALWMMDHIMNNRLSLELGEAYVRIPLEKSPHIHHGDALEIDWNDVLPGEQCSYVLGNPPFVGAKYQSAEQRAQVRRIADLGRSGGTLDYVTAWFIRAAEYVQAGEARIGFVATNSITQGEQVAQLWPVLFDRYGLEIAFAHRTFAWGSDARGVAHVHVVILGLDRGNSVPAVKRLYSYPDINADPIESEHGALTAYLFDAAGLADPHLTVSEENRPINRLGQLVSGTQPIDDGNYIFKRNQRDAFLEAEPGAREFLRPYVGSREYLRGGERWILALQEASPATLNRLPRVRERMAAVREFRSSRRRASTIALAEFPTRYNVEVLPATPFLVIPKVSSERRSYVPTGWLEPPTIPSDLVFVLQDATLVDFALLTSCMHMAWLRYIGGRLKSDYRYSIGLVYNNFPTPPEEANRNSLEPLAQAVLNARREHPEATLAELYDPDLMPPTLRRAHQNLDRAVDRLYRRERFQSERERAEHLFALYERMRSPLHAEMQPRPRRRPRRRSAARRA